jgi:diguanylate cyclase (GGDEF)-like protein/PAS domain S-box-containing protein
MRSEKAERLSRIVETQRDIAAAGLDPERVMALLVERSQALTGADGAMVSLLDGAELVTRAGAGIAAGTVGVRRPLGDSVAAHAIATGQPILIEDAESDPRIDQNMRRKVGDKSLICVPFFDGGRAVGALNVVSSSDTDRLDERDRETMEILAVVLSSAVSQATAFELKRQQIEALARFEAMYHGAPIGIAMISPEGHVVESNVALREMLGFSAEELAERPFSAYTHPDDVGENSDAFREVMAGERDGYRMEKRYVRKDGATVWGNVSVSLVRDAAGSPSFAVGMLENVTERKLAEEALKRQAELNRHQALHDSLTGLPNRVLFRERIEQTLLRASRQDEQVAVLLMDLDRFKEVNDALGHHAGDALLMEVGRRLPTVLRASDTVARLGGDGFVVLAEVESDEEAFGLSERIGAIWEAPFAAASGEVFCSASVGIAVGRKAEAPTKLLREADAAMYRAKDRGRGRSEIFDEEMRRDAFERLRTESDLRRALERDEFRVMYQPIFDTTTLRPIAVEALVRWQHPTRGIVGPVEFIPLAEETGLIAPLGRWVLEHAVAEVAGWSQEFPELPLRVAVNVSGQQLARPEFLQEVRAALEASDLPPELLGLEITESILINESGNPRSTLESLRKIGVKVLIDDFGTGYSSLARLKRFPLDVIKIDRSFVDGVGAEDEDTAIVAAIVDIARSLGLQVIAEGVEGEVQLERLRELGCHAAQGYLFSGPMQGDAFAAFLAGNDEPHTTAVA